MVLPSSEPWAQCLKKLLSFGELEMNETDGGGMTALHHAAGKGDAELIRALSQRPDINMNATSNDGLTPLMMAVLTHRTIIPPGVTICPEHHVASVRTLIGDSRVDVSYVNREGYTALALAARRGNIEMVDTLI
ncbi:ankyrin repeat-containing domain protein, partial [Coprinopsis sp. MPI-PUGE-AT-0042]